MNIDFKIAFSKLPLEEKRNQISNELMIIGELIKLKEQELNLISILNVKNYDSAQRLSESEMLDFLYEDIYNIQKELITLFSINDQSIE